MKQTIPVAGVDVSKRFSDMCILAPDNEIMTRMKIYHYLTSMERAAAKLQRVGKKCGAAPVIVMESTSHYYLILFQFFREAGYEVIVVNPIQSGALKNINVRKVKNDKVDAYKIAMLYRLKVLRTSQVPVDSLRGLRLLCCQRTELMNDVTRYKNHLTAYLDQIFPSYDKVFSDIGGAASRAVLRECPTPQILLLKDENELPCMICVAAYKHFAFMPPRKRRCDCFGYCYAVKSIWEIDQDIKALITQEPFIQKNLALLQTIPGIGPHSSVALLAESSLRHTSALIHPSGSPTRLQAQKTKCQNAALPMSDPYFTWLLLPLLCRRRSALPLTLFFLPLRGEMQEQAPQGCHVRRDTQNLQYHFCCSPRSKAL